MGLERMRRLLAELGSPEENLPVIHVAGTKGKGSTAAMIAAALSAAGYRTGLFTSPHVLRIEERIQVGGGKGDSPHLPERPSGCCAQMGTVPFFPRCIEAEDFDALVDLVRPAVERLDGQGAGSGEQGARLNGSLLPAPCSLPLFSPTFFEIITAMAFVHFARQKVQAAVMEVGLGGRLDATNVCRPVVSVITSISLDHTQQLGNTLTAIAGEKAGIIRPGVPVVSGVIEPEPRAVIRQVCRDREAPLVERGSDFDFAYEPPRHLEREAAVGRLEWQGARSTEQGAIQPCSLPPAPCSLLLSLPGRHQAANAAVALAAIEVLRTMYSSRSVVMNDLTAEREEYWHIPEAAVAAALGEMTWPARVEVVARRPAVVLDAAHNVASVAALVETLRESFSVARRLLIFGTTQDKDIKGMLASLLPEFDGVFFTRYQGSSRAVPPEELARIAEDLTGRRWPALDESSAAWSAARAAAGEDDLICITGSFYLAAEMKAGSREQGAGSKE